MTLISNDNDHWFNKSFYFYIQKSNALFIKL